MTTRNPLTNDERLQLQQLLQLNYWNARSPAQEQAEEHSDPSPKPSPDLPETWELTRGVVLHAWQEECVNAWFEAGRRGVLKVVTGAGKTLLALAIAERLQQSESNNLRIAIVVPTVVLLAQWREEFASRSNLPSSAIGFVGAGSDDSFSDSTRILVCVLNSAARKLPQLVRQAGIGRSLLLVVDECHRAGSAEMQRVLSTERAYSLGLSATPEREGDRSQGDDDVGDPQTEKGNKPVAFEDSIVGRELGPVIFELNYADAIARGVFTTRHQMGHSYRRTTHIKI